MGKHSKLGAAAIALALSVTLLAPVHAQAAKYETTQELGKVSDFTDTDSVIDIDYVKTDVFTGSYYYETKDKVLAAAVAKGMMTTVKPADTIKDIRTYTDSNDVIYYSNNNAYVTCEKVGKVYVGYATGVKYYNSQTKKSSIFKEEVYANYTANEAQARAFQPAIRVMKGFTTYLGVQLSGGDTKITGIKSSKKSVAKASLYGKMGSETTTNKDNVKIDRTTDPATGYVTYSVYYYTTVGAKVIVGTFSNEADAKAAAVNVEMTSSSAKRYIKIDGKKSGKTDLTFNIVNINGAISKVKIAVYVVDDMDVFSKLTFAGQSLLNEKDFYKKSFYAYEDGIFYTTKSKGKLVAKANKNFVIKKIEVGRLYSEPYSEGMSGTYPNGKEYDNSKFYSAFSKSGKTTSHYVDLNGDGDYEDVINGVKEDSVTWKYTRVKSGKTIKLNSVGTSYDSAYSYTSKSAKNRKGELNTSTTNTKSRNFYAATSIRIVFYDKLSKSYGTSEFIIMRSVNK